MMSGMATEKRCRRRVLGQTESKSIPRAEKPAWRVSAKGRRIRAKTERPGIDDARPPLSNAPMPLSFLGRTIIAVAGNQSTKLAIRFASRFGPTRIPFALAGALLPLIIALSPSMPSPSWATDAECTPIADALLRMTRQPIVRQVDTRTDFPGPIEMIFTQDATYARVGDLWKRTSGSGTTRLAQLEQALKAQALRDCNLLGEQEIGGVQTLLFKYAQGNAAATPMRLWVGSKDGLPYQWQAGPTLSKIQYAGIEIPAVAN